MRILLKIALVVLLFVSVQAARGQAVEGDIKLRLAESYERSGDYESAAKIYEGLYAKDSTNVILFDALRRDYMQLKKYDTAAVLIERRLSIEPDDVNLLAQLGRVYSYMANDAKANEAWDKAIAVAPANEGVYRTVSNAMLESRLFENAIRIYLRGRKTLGNPDLFTPDLAYLYTMVLNYTEATKEYLSLLKNDIMQLNYVQQRISMFTGTPAGLAAATKVVEDRSKADPDNRMVLEVLGWLYMEGKNYTTAFDVIRQIDDKTKSGGLRVEDFAERALNDRAYPVAAKAFQYVITTYPQFKMMAQVKFGYARTLEESDGALDTLNIFGGHNPFTGSDKPANESQPGFTGAVAEYKKIVDQYKGSEIAARSLIRIASVEYDRFYNLNEARSSLELVQTQYKGFIPQVMEADLMLGDVYRTMGDLGKAEAAYTAVTAFRTVTKEMQDKASYNLALLLYFNGKFSDAITKMQNLTKNAGANITNDALTMLLFLQENVKADSVALKDFAKADLLQRQRKLSEALEQYNMVAKKYDKTPLADETLMNTGDVLTAMKRYPEAVTIYDTLISRYPESVDLDKTMMKIARVYGAGLNNKPKAIETYQELLQKFPNSIYVSEARKMIRDLRGDSL